MVFTLTRTLSVLENQLAGLDQKDTGTLIMCNETLFECLSWHVVAGDVFSTGCLCLNLPFNEPLTVGPGETSLTLL